MMGHEEEAEHPCNLRGVMIHDAAEDLPRVVPGSRAFRRVAWNEAKHPGDEGDPREGLPFRSV